MRPKVKNILCWLLFGVGFSVMAQEGESETHETNSAKHSISVLLGHAHVSQGIKEGSKKWLALPSWMMAYNY